MQLIMLPTWMTMKLQWKLCSTPICAMCCWCTVAALSQHQLKELNWVRLLSVVVRRFFRNRHSSVRLQRNFSLEIWLVFNLSHELKRIHQQLNLPVRLPICLIFDVHFKTMERQTLSFLVQFNDGVKKASNIGISYNVAHWNWIEWATEIVFQIYTHKKPNCNHFFSGKNITT